MAQEPDEQQTSFLMSLFETTQGDGAIKVSMHDVGMAIGLDKEDVTRVAEAVIGVGWAEVKTLSGGIGISQEGVEKAVSLGARLPLDVEGVVCLGEEAVINDGVRDVVESVLASLKLDVAHQTFDFDTTAEMIADIRTLEMQLTSPKPKTAILRAGFESVKAVLGSANNVETLSQINQLLDG
jgi:hypothetical protein